MQGARTTKQIIRTTPVVKCESALLLPAPGLVVSFDEERDNRLLETYKLLGPFLCLVGQLMATSSDLFVDDQPTDTHQWTRRGGAGGSKYSGMFGRERK